MPLNRTPNSSWKTEQIEVMAKGDQMAGEVEVDGQDESRKKVGREEPIKEDYEWQWLPGAWS